MLVTAGDGVSALPNYAAEVTVPISLGVYTDCGTGCTSATLVRTYTPWASNLGEIPGRNFTDRWGNRFISVSASSVGCPGAFQCRSTFRQGRLTPSQDRGSLTLGELLPAP